MPSPAASAEARETEHASAATARSSVIFRMCELRVKGAVRDRHADCKGRPLEGERGVSPLLNLNTTRRVEVQRRRRPAASNVTSRFTTTSVRSSAACVPAVNRPCEARIARMRHGVRVARREVLVDARRAEHVAFRVHRFDHAVGEEHHLIAREQRDRLFEVHLVRLDAQRRCARFRASLNPSACLGQRGGLCRHWRSSASRSSGRTPRRTRS